MVYKNVVSKKSNKIKSWDFKTKKGNFGHAKAWKSGRNQGTIVTTIRSTGNGKRHTWTKKTISAHFVRK